ncbi:pectin acetylesterase 9-like [Amaranthus tricolor]|uniref:pectin acetylesterase 9-like n=1 Tax=Amaranthus tricolor TaxID=29722 RepID=UPI0025863C07|nr:pectin acetylesterase 9-like [Amaranthus tricolor]
MTTWLNFAVVLLLTCAPWGAQCVYKYRLPVSLTLVKNTTATTLGAYCLDGTLPAYQFNKGFGSGIRNWLLHFEGGGWCNDVESCLERAITRHGSTNYMDKVGTFSGILSDNVSLNPDFYNWNRVKLRYCDGASFAGDSKFDNGTKLLYFRGQKIWQAIIHDLLPLGLANADKALLSGASAGGLAAFLHCNEFSSFLPKTATVKCISDAGFFLDAPDIAKHYTIRTYFNDVVSLQGVEKNLDLKCTSSVDDPRLCFFEQHLLNYIRKPVFILNTAYDVFQLYNIFVPPTADVLKQWSHCKHNITTCTTTQIETLQAYRQLMIQTLDDFYKHSASGGMFIDSCFAHSQIERQDNWFAADSPTVQKKKIAEAVGDWYFERTVTKLIDCLYPCNKSCKNLLPA